MWLSIVLGFFFNYYFNNLWFILLFSGGLAAFRTFLKTEFSDENIEFWMACEEYKKVKSCTKMMSKANKIFKEFIDVQAPREVCVCYMTLLERWHLINKCNNLLWWFFFFFCSFISLCTFLSQQVNIDYRTREKIKQSLEEPSSSTLDEVQAQVYSLMEKDSYPRFLRSKMYQEIVNRVHAHSQRRSIWLVGRRHWALTGPELWPCDVIIVVTIT